MSMAICCDCDRLIDTDDDCDCFVETGNMRRLIHTEIVCEQCRESRERRDGYQEWAAAFHDHPDNK